MSEAFQEKFASPLSTKGDIYTYGTGDTRLAIGTDTQKLIADSSQTTGQRWADDTQFAVQANDQTFTDSTLVNVTSLLFAMAASTSYFCEVYLLLSSDNTNADYKFGWTVPASATMFWGHIGTTSGAGAVTTAHWFSYTTGATPDALLTAGSTLAIAAGNLTNGIPLWAIVRNSTNAGNLQLQAAQNATQGGTATKVLKDSLLRIRKLQ